MEALLGHPVPEPVPEQAVEEAVREFYMQAHAPMVRDIEHEHATDDDAQERIDQTVAEGPPPADYVLSFGGTKQQEDRQSEGAGASPALRRGTLEALAAIVNQVARNTYIRKLRRNNAGVGGAKTSSKMEDEYRTVKLCPTAQTLSLV